MYVSITDDVLIEDCTFTENFANFGGAVYFYGSEGVIRRCLFEGNHARKGGAGYFVAEGIVEDSLFMRNMSDVAGGAVQLDIFGIGSSFSMERCQLIANHSNGDGGAFECDIPGATVSNCLIASNTAEGFGGGILQEDGDDTRFVNCTIVDNHCAEEGGGVYRIEDQPFDFGIDWSNCILFANGPEQIAGVGPDNLRLTYSLVQGGWAGKGNIDADPLFQDAGGGDYRLQLASPCIDTASGTGPSEDLPGNPRPVDIPGVGHDGEGTFDMGAYEFQIAEMPTPTPTLTETPIPAPTLHPGTDINRSGKVDVEDLLLLIRDWRKVSGP
ncbi:MAG: hypothetical protein GHCLOJNM_04476 [bacterium]|nr:hypothetical protein [bacterium]